MTHRSLGKSDHEAVFRICHLLIEVRNPDASCQCWLRMILPV
jgi:hypothetical protein